MPVASIQGLLDAPIATRGMELARVREDQWFDRKSSNVKPRELAKTLIAFANAEGGTIVIGLANGAVEGISRLDGRRVNEWRQAGLDFVDPPISVRARVVDCTNSRDEPDELVVLDVESGAGAVHRTRTDDAYLRVGDEDRKLSFLERQELEFDRSQATYEATVVADAAIADLDPLHLARYADAVGHPDALRLLRSRGLVSASDGVSVGALLLFGREPQARFPAAIVRVIRYAGSERGTGARQQLVADARCEGAIPELIPAAQRAILAQIPTRTALTRRGVFEPVGSIPQDAWLEGLVNAVVHRSYSLSGDHIRAEIFDDRVEIESPGRFPGIAALRDPVDVVRFARNPRIARACAELQFAQELGEGIRRMFEEMNLAGLADPIYRQTSGSVRVTLFSAPFDRELESRLPRGARELMRAVREMERPSTGDLAGAVGLSRPSVIQLLRVLQEVDLVERVGKSRNDPRAYWRLASRVGGGVERL